MCSRPGLWQAGLLCGAALVVEMVEGRAMEAGEALVAMSFS